MTLLFELHYATQPGEQLYWTPSHQDAPAIAMHYAEGGLHYLSMEVAPECQSLDYQYELRKGEIALTEKQGQRHLCIDRSVKQMTVIDAWQWYPPNRPFFSAAFTDNLFARHKEPILPNLSDRRSTIELKLFAPTAEPQWRVGLTGEGGSLGEWAGVLAMRYEGEALWSVELDATSVWRKQEYKFVFYTPGGEIVRWEGGANRSLDFPFPKEEERTVVTGLHFADSSPSWHGTGVAIPVFSIRTERSWGIGDFADLRAMIRWADAHNMRLLQLLPINDTTLTHTPSDSYPYNANSIYALHPLYLSMNELPPLSDKKRAAHYSRRAKTLNAGETVDYAAVDTLKWEYLHELFAQEHERVAEDKAFRQWWNSNRSWAEAYVAYSWLRDHHRSTRFADWGEYAEYSPRRVQRLLKEHLWSEWGVYAYVQYQLHLQLTAASAVAREKRVVIKGDIPIGISPNSVEAWTEPHLFNLDMQAGAPPDAFSTSGQNWGFPTYNWEAMKRDDYRWWRERLRKMAEYFDAYRIDHLLGFFRIWEIPRHSVEGLLGHFSPALPYSVEELNGAGFHFNKSRDTIPLFRLSYLHALFGKESDTTERFFHSLGNGYWSFKPIANTQRGIEAALNMAGMANDTELREKLFSLANGVLFVEDPRQPGRYHPRIGGYDAPIFNELDEAQQAIYRQLHHHYFYERNNGYWREMAMERLPALLEATKMLVCAEDLGMIPACVPEVMRELQMLSLEIERMPKGFERFGQPSGYPYLSVATTSTHDMSPLRLWWEEEWQRASEYYHHELHHADDAPKECTPAVAQQIIERHLNAPSQWVILPWQDWVAAQHPEQCASDPRSERINVPADSNNYWRWRIKESIE